MSIHLIAPIAALTCFAVTAGTVSSQSAFPATASAFAQAAPAEAPAPPATIANGRRLFIKSGCGGCHGLEGQGAPTTGPRLAPQPLPLAALIRYVRAPRVQMPPYSEKVLTDQEVSDIRAFLVSRPPAVRGAAGAP